MSEEGSNFAVLFRLKIEVLVDQNLYQVSEHDFSEEPSRFWRHSSQHPVQIIGHEWMLQAPRVTAL